VWQAQQRVPTQWLSGLQVQQAIALALKTRPINSNKLPTTVNV
jgi:hypothetical protein